MKNTTSQFIQQLEIIKSIMLAGRLQKFIDLFLVNEVDYLFLDLNQLRDFITLNRIKNFTFLSEIVNLCNSIIYISETNSTEDPLKRFKNYAFLSESYDVALIGRMDEYAIIELKQHKAEFIGYSYQHIPIKIKQTPFSYSQFDFETKINDNIYDQEAEDIHDDCPKSFDDFENFDDNFERIQTKEEEEEEEKTDSFPIYIDDSFFTKKIRLHQVIFLCRMVKELITKSYPDLNTSKITDLYKDNYSLLNTRKNPLTFLEALYPFSEIDYNNLKYMHPITHDYDQIGNKDIYAPQELYQEYFTDNHFLIFEILLETLEITNKSRADVKFIFETMKSNEEIHSHITQNGFLEWFNNKYGFNIGKTSNFSKTQRRIDAYNNAKLEILPNSLPK